MRKLLGVLALTLGLTGFTMLAPYIPAAPTVKYHVSRGAATCVVTWADSTATVVRTEIRRRGIIADTAVTHGRADTTWSPRGTVGVSGGTTGLRDPCDFGRTYRYQVRDSIATVAFSGWSDSTAIVVPTRKF